MKPQGKQTIGWLPEKTASKLQFRRLKKDLDAYIFLLPAYIGAFIFLWKSLLSEKINPRFWEEFFTHTSGKSTILVFFFLILVSFINTFKSSTWKKTQRKENWTSSLGIGSFQLFRVTLFDALLKELPKFIIPFVFLFWASEGTTPSPSSTFYSILAWLAIALLAYYLSALSLPEKGRPLSAAFSKLLTFWLPKSVRPICQRDISQLLRFKEPLFYIGLLALTGISVFIIQKYKTEAPPKWIWWTVGILTGHFFSFTAHRVFSDNLKFVWREFSLPVTAHGFWLSRVFTPVSAVLPASVLLALTAFYLKISGSPIEWTLIFHVFWLPLGVAGICGALAFEGNKKHSSLNMMITFLAALGFGFMFILHYLCFILVPILIKEFHEKMEHRMKSVCLDENPF